MKYNIIENKNSFINSNSLSIILEQAKKYKVLKREEEYNLFLKLKEDDQILTTLTNHNLKLVIAIVKKYNNKNIDLESLMSISLEALVVAIKNYKPSKDIKFSSYCIPCITGVILSYITKDNGIIRIKNTKRNKQLLKDKDNSSFEYNNIVNIKNMVSLDQQISNSEDSNETLYNSIENKNSHSPTQTIFDEEKTMVLNEILRCLKDREKEILIDTFGLFDKPVISLEDQSKKYDVCKNRILEIRTTSFKKILKAVGNNQEKLKELFY